jgi:hypothetical protein
MLRQAGREGGREGGRERGRERGREGGRGVEPGTVVTEGVPTMPPGREGGRGCTSQKTLIIKTNFPLRGFIPSRESSARKITRGEGRERGREGKREGKEEEKEVKTNRRWTCRTDKVLLLTPKFEYTNPSARFPYAP